MVHPPFFPEFSLLLRLFRCPPHPFDLQLCLLRPVQQSSQAPIDGSIMYVVFVVVLFLKQRTPCANLQINLLITFRIYQVHPACRRAIPEDPAAYATAGSMSSGARLLVWKVLDQHCLCPNHLARLRCRREIDPLPSHPRVPSHMIIRNQPCNSGSQNLARKATLESSKHRHLHRELPWLLQSVFS